MQNSHDEDMNDSKQMGEDGSAVKKKRKYTRKKSIAKLNETSGGETNGEAVKFKVSENDGDSQMLPSETGEDSEAKKFGAASGRKTPVVTATPLGGRGRKKSAQHLFKLLKKTKRKKRKKTSSGEEEEEDDDSDEYEIPVARSASKLKVP